MNFNRAHYSSDANCKMHQEAWAKLLKAIDAEERGEMASARTSLVMACNMELKALGFESMLTQLNKSTLAWNPPRRSTHAPTKQEGPKAATVAAD